jgi:hypothetical protein
VVKVEKEVVQEEIIKKKKTNVAKEEKKGFDLPPV